MIFFLLLATNLQIMSKLNPRIKFIYKLIGCDNPELNDMTMRLSADTREEADTKANDEAALFGESATVIFMKEI